MDVNLNLVRGASPSIQPEVLPIDKVTEKELAPQVEQHQDVSINKQELEKAIADVNDMIEPHRTSLHYAYHEKLHTYYVQIVDSQTDKVIKEIPPKKFLDMYAMMAEQLGFITDDKV